MKTVTKIAVIVFKIVCWIVINLVIPFVFGVWGLCVLLIAELIRTKRQNQRTGKTLVSVTYKGKKLQNRALCFANSDKSQGYIRVNKHHVAVKKTRLGWVVK